MERFQGIIGILVIFALIYAFSRARKHIRWRPLGVGLALQVASALLVLKWDVGLQALIKVSEGVQKLSDFTNHGTSFVFGELFGMEEDSFIFALNVLPVIIVLGAPVLPAGDPVHRPLRRHRHQLPDGHLEGRGRVRLHGDLPGPGRGPAGHRPPLPAEAHEIGAFSPV